MSVQKYHTSSSVVIAVDAMGGDFGIKSTIPGLDIVLTENSNVRFLIFGDARAVQPMLDSYPAVKAVSELVHVDRSIKGDEKPSSALRTSKDTSMREAIEAVKDGRAAAVVSSGNTGALMALAKMVLKPLPGIHRPALASVFPTIGEPTIMLDLGANVLVDAVNLAQFAVMGAAFARVYKQKALPVVGLLNVGTEDTKGPDHVRAASILLQEIDFSGHYFGYVEGNDINKGVVDVIVTDGYAGNIALKTVEGMGAFSGHLLKSMVKSDPLAMLGGLLSFFALKRLKQKVDPRRYNGGVFLGLNGICVKSHGGCDALGFSTAVKLALNMAQSGYVQAVAQDIQHVMSQETLLS